MKKTATVSDIKALTSKRATEIKTIEVFMFTGLLIGKLPVTEETSETIKVMTKQNRTLDFNKATGLQINATNPKYGNKILPIVTKSKLLLSEDEQFVLVPKGKPKKVITTSIPKKPKKAEPEDTCPKCGTYCFGECSNQVTIESIYKGY